MHSTQPPHSIAPEQCHNGQHLHPHGLPPSSVHGPAFSTHTCAPHTHTHTRRFPSGPSVWNTHPHSYPMTLCPFRLSSGITAPREAGSQLLCYNAGGLQNRAGRMIKTFASLTLNTGASPESQGGSVTGVLPGFITSLSAFPAIATRMGPNQESVIQGPEFASAR